MTRSGPARGHLGNRLESIVSHKNGLYTAAIALAVVVLVNKYGSRVGMRHGA